MTSNTPKITLDGDGVLTATEVSSLLGLSKFTLLRMRQRGARSGLPYVQLSPGRIGYLRSDVRAYLAARRVTTTDELTEAA
jgi:predicted DNA-binding transcriptional regulator AlpA